MFRTVAAAAVMVVAAVWLYLPTGALRGEAVLRGADYRLLHQYRLEFAQAELRAHGTLPGWYGREGLGAPFTANLQSFPLLPTRLLLLAVNPANGFTVGVALAAALAALAAFALARRLGASPWGAVATGFTFAAAGFFSTRVAAGHLPLLEAYPAAPLLLWLADRAADPSRAPRHAWDLLALALAAASFALAGHPQLPFYALAATAFFLVFRHPRERPWRPGPQDRALAALALGGGLSLFAWVPMFELAGQSTRVLALNAPDNDVALPFGRLPALVAPWVDGWPPLAGGTLFHGYPSVTYFWETAAYAGVIPLLAAAVLGGLALRRRALAPRPVALVFLAGGLALLWALPLSSPLRAVLPGTLLRCPARALYLSTLAVALAFGRGVDAVGQSALRPPLRATLAGALVLFQVLDLGNFSRIFVLPAPPQRMAAPQLETALRAGLGDGRTGIDRKVDLGFGRDFDDVGSFDSLLLARPYRALLAMSGVDPRANLQVVDGAMLSPGALAFAGVTEVLTHSRRDDLELVQAQGPLNLYRVRDAAPRAEWVAEASAEFAPDDEVLARLRASRGEGLPPLVLPPEATPPGARQGSGEGPIPVHAERSGDQWRLDVQAPAAGYVRVVEAWHPGWRASVDGQPARVWPATTCLMAVAVPAGAHHVELDFETPGRRLGTALTALCAALLLGLTGWAWRRGRTAARV